MVGFLKILMIFFGFMAVAGGLYKAGELWPTAETTADFLELTDEFIALMNQGREAEANALWRSRELANSIGPIQREAAIYWAVSGVVSASIFWTFAMILHILSELQGAVSQVRARQREAMVAIEGAGERHDAIGQEQYRSYEILQRADGTYTVHKGGSRVRGSQIYRSAKAARDFVDYFG